MTPLAIAFETTTSTTPRVCSWNYLHEKVMAIRGHGLNMDVVHDLWLRDDVKGLRALLGPFFPDLIIEQVNGGGHLFDTPPGTSTLFDR